MNIRSKEGKITGLILVVLCLLIFASCTNKEPGRKVEYPELLKKLESGEIRTIEVLYNPCNIDWEGPQTINDLIAFSYYRIIIKFPYGANNLEDVLQKYSPSEEIEFYDSSICLGLLFFDKNDKEVYAMYFSSASPAICIDKKMYRASKDLYKLVAAFIPGVRQKSFEERIDFLFPEKSEEAAK